jgi:hypothetical protein
VISPLLANIYLHYVFDLWADRWRRQQAHGDVIMVRYADDIVVGFEHQADAARFLTEMRERLAAFALTLHGEKTRLIRFGRFAAQNRKERGEGKPETPAFAGAGCSTFLASPTSAGAVPRLRRGRLRGGFLLRRKTRRDRMQARLLAIQEGLRRRLHTAIDEQGRWLRQVVGGFLAYHAVPTNYEALAAFRHHVIRLWRRTLRRRSQKDKTSWQRINALAGRWLPKPHITHPWPSVRFAVKYPRWEPYAGNPPVRFCAGGAP